MRDLQSESSVSDIIVRGECRGQAANFLLDTGAMVSLVSTRLVHQLDKMHDIQPTTRLIAGLGKEIIPMRQKP